MTTSWETQPHRSIHLLPKLRAAIHQSEANPAVLSNEFENTLSAINSQLMAVTSIIAVSAFIGPMMLDVIDDDEEPQFRQFKYESQPEAVSSNVAVSASIGPNYDVGRH
jgi:hypothetical protein